MNNQVMLKFKIESKDRDIQNPIVKNGFEILHETAQITFQGLCPYCKGDLTYQCSGWEMDEHELWRADFFDMKCSTEPSIDDNEWEDWMNQHSDMPYVYQLPVDEKVKAFINSKFRFEISE